MESSLNPGRWNQLLAAFGIGDEVATFLGVDEASYAQFESNVRQEYRWVPSILFRRKRAEILESFLARPHIYNTESFRTCLEAPARRNLTAAIANLRR